jgi:hypothetical protein
MEYIYETPKKSTDADTQEEDNEEEYDEGDENLKEFGTSKFGPFASPYIIPYIHNRRFLDKVYGIRKDDDGSFRIEDTEVEISDDSDVIIKGRYFTGMKGLYELLTRKK